VNATKRKGAAPERADRGPRLVEAALGGNFNRQANCIRGQSQAARREALTAIVKHIRRFGSGAVGWASDLLVDPDLALAALRSRPPSPPSIEAIARAHASGRPPSSASHHQRRMTPRPKDHDQ
jgi:hypothetical protein